MSVGDWNDASGFGTDCAGDGHCCFINLANCTNVSGFDIVSVTAFACCSCSASVSEHSSIAIGSWSRYLSIELDDPVWIFSRHGGQFCSFCSHLCGHSDTSHPVQLIVCPSLRLQALQQNPWSHGPSRLWKVQPQRLHFACLHLLHNPLAGIKLRILLECLTWLEHKQLLVHTCMSIFLHLSKIATYAGQTLQKIM